MPALKKGFEKVAVVSSWPKTCAERLDRVCATLQGEGFAASWQKRPVNGYNLSLSQGSVALDFGLRHSTLAGAMNFGEFLREMLSADFGLRDMLTFDGVFGGEDHHFVLETEKDARKFTKFLAQQFDFYKIFQPQPQRLAP